MSHPGKHSTFFVYLSNDDDDSDSSNSCSEAKRKPKKMPKGQRTYTARQQQQHQQLPPSTFHFHPLFDEATNKNNWRRRKRNTKNHQSKLLYFHAVISITIVIANARHRVQKNLQKNETTQRNVRTTHTACEHFTS